VRGWACGEANTAPESWTQEGWTPIEGPRSFQTCDLAWGLCRGCLNLPLPRIHWKDEVVVGHFAPKKHSCCSETWLCFAESKRMKGENPKGWLLCELREEVEGVGVWERGWWVFTTLQFMVSLWFWWVSELQWFFYDVIIRENIQCLFAIIFVSIGFTIFFFHELINFFNFYY